MGALLPQHPSPYVVYLHQALRLVYHFEAVRVVVKSVDSGATQLSFLS